MYGSFDKPIMRDKGFKSKVKGKNRKIRTGN